MVKKAHGDRNQCTCCKEWFNTVDDFDMHRTGEYGKDRRCMSVQEMRNVGMRKNSARFWYVQR